MPTTRECGCVFDHEGDPLELCAAHRPTDEPIRRYTCGSCGERGHTARTCGMSPEQRYASRRGPRR